MQGRLVNEMPNDLTEEDAVVEGTRATGQQTAANLLSFAGALLCEIIEREATQTEEHGTKAGMMPDPVGGCHGSIAHLA